jgi:molybdopterin/thiamine biosynthesis adenylyltransferase
VDTAHRPGTLTRGFTTEMNAYPSAEAIAALRTVDLIIGCVDGWDTRDDLNTFALEHRIPYIDIAATITPGENAPRVSGQIAILLPGSACLRCMKLITDERVQASRRQRQGYLVGEPDPQVVSINGTLASEAVTAALLLVASSDASLESRRNYRYPPGRLLPAIVAQDPECSSCRRAGLISGQDQEHDPNKLSSIAVK